MKFENQVFPEWLLWHTELTSMARSMMLNRKNVILIGMPGSGKSRVGRALSSYIGRGYLDLDQWITKQYGKTPAEVIEAGGVEAWRALEQKALRRFQGSQKMVLSLGGGCIQNEEVVERIKSLGVVVYLECELSSLVLRLSSSSEVKKRPLLTDALDEGGNVRKESLETLLRGLRSERREWYERTADIVVPTDHASEDICAQWLQVILQNEDKKEGESGLWSHLKVSY